MLTVETPEGVYLNVRSQHEHASDSAVCMSLAPYAPVKLARDDDRGLLVLALQGDRIIGDATLHTDGVGRSAISARCARLRIPPSRV